MATTVFETHEIALQDGTEITLRPLPIARLRKFMARWDQFIKKVREDELTDAEAQDEQFECYVDLAIICLAPQLKGEKSDESFREYVELSVDEPTLFTIFDKCGGLKLNDPNLLAAATEMEKAV